MTAHNETIRIEQTGEPCCVLLVWTEHREIGARLPYLFYQANISVDLLGADFRVLTLSRHIRHKVHCRPEETPHVLRQHLAESGIVYDWIILGDEETLYTLLDDPDGGWAEIFPVDFCDNRPQIITSKTMFTLSCQKRNIPMPPSVICEQAEKLGDAATRLGYPVMVKTDRGCAGNGVHYVENSDAMPGVARMLPGGPWIVQKFIPGRVGSTQLLLDHGKPACWFASLKHTVWPPPYGPSCVRELFEHPDMLARLEEIGTMTGFHGLCGVDWIVDANNQLYVLELNARPTPCYHLGPFAGVDFVMALGEIARGEEVTVQTPQPLKSQLSLIYMWPQYGYYCLHVGGLLGLLNLLPGRKKTDFMVGEPGVLRANTIHFVRESARHLKYKLLRHLDRKTQRLGVYQKK